MVVIWRKSDLQDLLSVKLQLPLRKSNIYQSQIPRSRVYSLPVACRSVRTEACVSLT